MARRSLFVPLCAVWALLASGLWCACLNPMPDDFPSGHDDDGSAPAEVQPVGNAGTGGTLEGPGDPSPESGGSEQEPGEPVNEPPAANEAPDAGAPPGDAGSADAGASRPDGSVAP